MNAEYVLEMEHIVKTFPGVRALRDGCIKLRKGEIHALIGENGAGKSTLMKILIGDYPADSGAITFKGKPSHIASPRQAEEAGLCIIPQEINIVNTSDVAENIWLGREHQFSKCGFINKKSRYLATQELFERIGIDLHPHDLGASLSLAKKQLLTIARVISCGADLIIMDEPTSSLTGAEVDNLFRVMRDLRAKGTSIIFISHKIEEIYTICDRITVMRDGAFIGEFLPSEIKPDRLIAQIAGREIASEYPPKRGSFGEVVLKVSKLESRDKFYNISFDVRAGEVLGLYGLVGAGRSEIMRAVFGVDPYDHGEVWLNGRSLPAGKPHAAVKSGMAMVTEDRLLTGIVSIQSVRMNVSLANLFRFVNKIKFVRKKEELEKVLEIISRLDVRCASVNQAIGGLSGGNQQKAVIARWLLTQPKLLILDEPTRGIDVGAKSEIHKLIAELARQGMAVVIISSELPEAMGISDRIITIKDGRMVKEFVGNQIQQEAIVNAAFGLTDITGGCSCEA